MVSKVSYTLILVFSFLFLLNGCSERIPSVSSPSDFQNQPTPKSRNSDISSEQTLDISINELSAKEAWGDIPIIQKVYFEKPRIYFSISEDGELLSGDDDGSFESDTTLIISDIYSDSEENIKIVEWPKQIMNASINSSWVVWVEAVVVGISSDSYEVYAYDRKTKNIKLYFKTPTDKDGKPFGGHTPKPSLLGDEFLIDVVFPSNEEGLSIITSRKYDLITGKYQDIAEQFALPTWSGSGYVGIEEDKERKGYSIITKLTNGIREPLMDKGAYIYDYVASDGSAAIIAQRSDDFANVAQERNLWLLEDGKETLISKATPGNPDGCAWPSISKRFVIWTNSGKGYAYDRKLNVIVKLSEGDSCAAYTNNKYLLWESPSKQDIDEKSGYLSMLNIIEIDKLP